LKPVDIAAEPMDLSLLDIDPPELGSQPDRFLPVIGTPVLLSRQVVLRLLEMRVKLIDGARQ